MSQRTLNFDNFMSEKEREPIIVTVYGKDYKVKPEIPAVVMVTLARLNDSSVPDFESAKMLMHAADILFGKETINEFCDHGMSSEEIVTLIRMVFDTINGKDVDGDDVESISDEDGMVSANGNRGKK